MPAGGQHDLTSNITLIRRPTCPTRWLSPTRRPSTPTPCRLPWPARRRTTADHLKEEADDHRSPTQTGIEALAQRP